MNGDQKAAVIEKLAVLAEMYGRTFSPNAIVHMSDAIDDLDFTSVMQTLNAWARTEKTFPHPADIREKIKPEINPEDDAQDVANLIIGAIGKYGYTNPESARMAMGELGWETVRRMGGWKSLCETVTLQNAATYRAQIRDYAGTVRRKAMRGELDERTALPRPAATEVQKLISKAFREGLDS